MALETEDYFFGLSFPEIKEMQAKTNIYGSFHVCHVPADMIRH